MYTVSNKTMYLFRYLTAIKPIIVSIEKTKCEKNADKCGTNAINTTGITRTMFKCIK
jgi:hypothetical protein